MFWYTKWLSYDLTKKISNLAKKSGKTVSLTENLRLALKRKVSKTVSRNSFCISKLSIFLTLKSFPNTVWKFHDFPALRFDVKSISGILEVPKSCHFLQFYIIQDLNFGNFWPFKVAEFHQNQSSEPVKLFKRRFFNFFNL